MLANLRPMQARAPKTKQNKKNYIHLLRKKKQLIGKTMYIPTPKAVKSSGLELYQREGLYSSGSSKYLGLYSVIRVSSNSKHYVWYEKESVRRPTMSTTTYRRNKN